MSMESQRTVTGNWGDRICQWICQSATGLLVLLMLALIYVLVSRSWQSVEVSKHHFFLEKRWEPNKSRPWDNPSATKVEQKKEEDEDDLFKEPEKDKKADLTQPPPLGSLAFLWGTLFSSLIGMVIAVPLGLGTAAYLSELAPEWVRKFGVTLVEMLAAVPSVVFGFWGLMVLGPSLNALSVKLFGPDYNFGGVGLFPAGIILGIMILPYVCAVSFDVCRSVPSTQRQASLALGATRWQTIWNVVLPYARPGILAACFIALGRALGETMAVTMLIGNTPQISLSIFSRAATIPSVIANELPNADYGLYRSALVELALFLFIVTLLVNVSARWLLSKANRIGPATWLSRLRGRVFGSINLFSRIGSDSLNAARVKLTDKIMRWLMGGAFIITVLPLGFVIYYLISHGVSGLSWEFFSELPKPMGETGGGLKNALLGSLLLVGFATLFAVPVGLLAGIYLAEYKSGRFGQFIRFIAETMGGVPSIVIGIFGYVVVVEGSRALFGLERPSLFGWAGVFSLAVMMLPIVIRTSEEALRLVPKQIRHASLALGAKNWQTLMRVTLPAALPAILTAIFLSISRVVGETAPLLITAGTSYYMPKSMSDYVPSIPFFIYDYAKDADVYRHNQAWAAALVLLVTVMLLNYGIRFLFGKRAVLAARAD